MPYKDLNELPDEVKALDKDLQKIWMSAFNAALKQYDGDEKKAFAVAWAAVKKEQQKAASMLATIKKAKELGQTAPEWFQVFPPGEIWLEDEDEPALMDAEGAALIMARFEARDNDMVIDYEHQTLEGIKAPAAGWIDRLDWRGESVTGGLWAHTTWTEEAAGYIEKREYRYFSPVFDVRLSDRRIVALHNVALTNWPLIVNIRALAAKRQIKARERSQQMIGKLRTILGLKEDATEESILQVVTSMVAVAKASMETLGIKAEGTAEEIAKSIKAKMDKGDESTKIAPEILEALSLKEGSTNEQIVASIKKLRDESGKKDDIETRFAAMKKEHDQLKKQWAERDRDERVDKAIKAGKISPAQKEWALGYAMKDPEGFDGFIAKQPVVVPLEDLKKGETGQDGGTPAERMERLIAKKCKENDKLTYGEAMNIVSKENPELAQRYMDSSRS